MMMSFWIVILPGGDRPYLHSAPPPELPRKEWESKGGRVFRVDAELPIDNDPAIQAIVSKSYEPLVGDLDRERAAHARTQHWLEQFQSATAAETVRVMRATEHINELEALLECLRDDLCVCDKKSGVDERARCAVCRQVAELLDKRGAIDARK